MIKDETTGQQLINILTRHSGREVYMWLLTVLYVNYLTLWQIALSLNLSKLRTVSRFFRHCLKRNLFTDVEYLVNTSPAPVPL